MRQWGRMFLSNGVLRDFLPSIFISVGQSKDSCLYPLANNGRGFNSIYQPRVVFHPETERGTTPRPHSCGSLGLVAPRLRICMTTVASPNTLTRSRMPLAPIAKPLNFTSLRSASSGKQCMFQLGEHTVARCGETGVSNFVGGSRICGAAIVSCFSSSCVDTVSLQLRCGMTS